jgi:hypothetical protein
LYDYLSKRVGPRLAAVIVGVQVTGGDPPPGSRKTLEIAHQAIDIITEGDSLAVANSWMRGMNPWLHDKAPALALRDGDFAEVIVAAKAMRDDTWF